LKYLKFVRIAKIKTSPKVCLEIMFDYSHFLFKHKSSFNDFKVISDKNNEQIFYYETKIFNFIPWSPVRQFIAIKKLIPEKQKFHQIYLDLASKNVFFFRCSMTNKGENVKIIHEVNIPVSNFLYIFRKILLIIINKKFDVMWHEDKEMLNQLYLKKDFKNIQCFAKNYNLENIFYKEFDKHFDQNKKPDLLIDT